MDDNALADAYRALLDAAATVGDTGTTPPAGEWNADQILAHVCLVTAATIAAAGAVAAGANTTYDNRNALDTWTIQRVIDRAGSNVVLRERLRRQGEILSGFAGAALSEAELDTMVPTLLLSAGQVLVDQLVPLRELLSGLATNELPGHTAQLLALLPEKVSAAR